ncbi:nuclear inhibitor of protein phosphatase 1 [Sabethes cyaneus]|uniref:nuclear inhibitor of protein phosphatase 1 n=1 Tax=Sabethes cyaneus TaxID=53552 RepID=UPI00237E4164|nr:nuclear inhibitor of protein phosphatase 1 [Sabethes cyaneus]XP_053687522.1 nuclear inhibitor of protein phosphatase 1 [Sabethes cyaneus]
MSNHYEIPSWAGKPPTGLHLDVMKDDKLIQKLMIDEKKCYLFGRNPQMNDFCIDHASCSRVHAAFVYHKHLNIAYLVDLGSTHGTYIGSVRLEPNKPTQLQINSQFHFGASTRHYMLRERPTVGSRSNIMEDIPMMDTSDGTYLGLPESQTELDNLTEYNTAHNRRISMLGIADETTSFKKNMKNKRKRKGVQFNEDEIIINPEDIDPSIGRFRNLIQSTVVPVAAKRTKFDINSMGFSALPSSGKSIQHSHSLVPSLYHGIDDHASDSRTNVGASSTPGFSFDMDTTPSGLTSKLGIILPNPAPDVNPISVTSSMMPPPLYNTSAPKNVKIVDKPDVSDEPKKKKYAKEQWPGRKPLGLGGF